MREYNESIAVFNRVEDLRKKKGWSLYMLAQKANISCNALYHWRDRKSSPTLYLLEAIADALGVTIYALLFDSEKIENLTTEQKSLIDKWKNLKDKEKMSLLSVISAFLEKED